MLQHSKPHSCRCMEATRMTAFGPTGNRACRYLLCKYGALFAGKLGKQEFEQVLHTVMPCCAKHMAIYKSKTWSEVTILQFICHSPNV